jgi:hypothetical protein
VRFPFPFPVVTVDPIMSDEVAPDTAEESLRHLTDWLDASCAEFAETAQKSDWWVRGGMAETNEKALARLIADVDDTYYIGEIGEFWVFRGPYMIMVDKYRRDIYFLKVWHEAWSLDLVNEEFNPDDFMLYYFSG